jgi:hypothetical protein
LRRTLDSVAIKVFKLTPSWIKSRCTLEVDKDEKNNIHSRYRGHHCGGDGNWQRESVPSKKANGIPRSCRS